jgi:hypothetical protein
MNQFEVEPHALGVVVMDHEGNRELLIEGESCCGIPFEQLQKIAATIGCFEVPKQVAATCRLKRM